MAYNRELHELRNQLEEARETIRQLTDLVRGDQLFYSRLRLSKLERVVVTAIMASPGTCRSERLIECLNFCGQGGDHDIKGLGVVICRIRHKLAHRGILVGNEWGVGYVFTPENRELMLALK